MDYGNLKVPENVTPEVQAILDSYEARNKEIENAHRKNTGRIWLGSVLSGASAHPVFNIPYIGTGLGGALYELGQGITEGDKLPELAKRTGAGFAIGETVGAIPYAGKYANKLSGGKIGNALTAGVEKIASTPLGQKVAEIAPKVEDALNIDVSPNTLLEQFKARQEYKNLGVNSPKFQEFYKDAKLYDQNNNPLMLYHGTPRGGFNSFDLAKAGESNSNEAKLGVWFGDTPHIAENFANNTWWGKQPQIYKTYANLKNPKVYEINKEENALLLQNLENARTQKELDLINNYKPFTQGVVFENFDNWYLDDKKAQRELVKDLTGLSDKLTYYKKNGYTPDSVQYKFGLENEFENNFRGVIPEKQQEFINYIEQNRDKIEAIRNIRNDIHYIPDDSYGAFLNDIDKFNTRRPHGLKDHWGANPEDIQNYKQDLINQGYDGIIIKNTTADAEESGLPYLNQYVVFNPNQIKSVNNSGMFDDTVNNLYDKNLKRATNKNLYDYIKNDSVLTKGYRENKKTIDKNISNLYDSLVTTTKKDILNSFEKFRKNPELTELRLSNVRNDLKEISGSNDIYLLQGNEKGGMKHILSKHPEDIDIVADTLKNGSITKVVPNRKVFIESNDGHCLISLDYNGNKKTWLLTGYKKN